MGRVGGNNGCEECDIEPKYETVGIFDSEEKAVLKGGSFLDFLGFLSLTLSSSSTRFRTLVLPFEPLDSFSFPSLPLM